jgi:hypothetical protein
MYTPSTRGALAYQPSVVGFGMNNMLTRRVGNAAHLALKNDFACTPAEVDGP